MHFSKLLPHIKGLRRLLHYTSFGIAVGMMAAVIVIAPHFASFSEVKFSKCHIDKSSQWQAAATLVFSIVMAGF